METIVISNAVRNSVVRFASPSAEANLVKQIEIHHAAQGLASYLLCGRDYAEESMEFIYPVEIEIGSEVHIYMQCFTLNCVVSLHSRRELCIVSTIHDDEWLLVGVRLDISDEDFAARRGASTLRLLPDVLVYQDEGEGLKNKYFGDAIAYFLRQP